MGNKPRQKTADKSLLVKAHDTKFPAAALKQVIPLPVFLDPNCTYSAKDLGCAYAKKASEFLLAKYGICENVYEMELGMFAHCVQFYLVATKDLETNGLIQEGAHGPIPNPSFNQAEKMRIGIEKFLDRFGLSPKHTLPDHALHNMGALAVDSSAMGVNL